MQINAQLSQRWTVKLKLFAPFSLALFLLAVAAKGWE
jgi:hypothetical protein